MLRLRENERKIRRDRRLAGEEYIYTIVFVRAKTTRERSQVSKLQRETSAKGLSELSILWCLASKVRTRVVAP